MLRTLQIGVVALGIAFFLALAGLAYYSSAPPAELNKQQTAGQADNKQPEKEKHSLRGFIRFLFPDAISIFTFWLVIATILLGILGYTQISFLGRAEIIAAKSANAAKDASDAATASAKAANEANQLSRETFVAGQRPWVSLTRAALISISYNVNGANFRVVYTIKNVGRSPAQGATVEVRVSTISQNWNPEAEQRRLCDEIKGRPDSPGWLRYVLFPDETNSFDITVTISKDEIEAARNFGSTRTDFISPVIIGCVDYRLASGSDHHQTGFIFNVNELSDAGILLALNVEHGDRTPPQAVLTRWINGFWAD